MASHNNNIPISTSKIPVKIKKITDNERFTQNTRIPIHKKSKSNLTFTKLSSRDTSPNFRSSDPAISPSTNTRHKNGEVPEYLKKRLKVNRQTMRDTRKTAFNDLKMKLIEEQSNLLEVYKELQEELRKKNQEPRNKKTVEKFKVYSVLNNDVEQPLLNFGSDLLQYENDLLKWNDIKSNLKLMQKTFENFNKEFHHRSSHLQDGESFDEEFLQYANQIYNVVETMENALSNINENLEKLNDFTRNQNVLGSQKLNRRIRSLEKENKLLQKDVLKLANDFAANGIAIRKFNKILDNLQSDSEGIEDLKEAVEKYREQAQYHETRTQKCKKAYEEKHLKRLQMENEIRKIKKVRDKVMKSVEKNENKAGWDKDPRNKIGQLNRKLNEVLKQKSLLEEETDSLRKKLKECNLLDVKESFEQSQKTIENINKRIDDLRNQMSTLQNTYVEKGDRINKLQTSISKDTDSNKTKEIDSNDRKMRRELAKLEIRIKENEETIQTYSRMLRVRDELERVLTENNDSAIPKLNELQSIAHRKFLLKNTSAAEGDNQMVNGFKMLYDLCSVVKTTEKEIAEKKLLEENLIKINMELQKEKSNADLLL